LGQTFFVPGERSMPNEIALATDGLSLSASFPREDQVIGRKTACMSSTNRPHERWGITACRR
jgi:hypothetical protein